jgi:hypothetical protein
MFVCTVGIFVLTVGEARDVWYTNQMLYSSIATCYGLDGMGILSQWVKFSASGQTGPGAHQASYTLGIRCFSCG